MPITPDMMAMSGDRIRFEKPGKATVLIGPCTSRAWTEKKIILDGRHYKCAGTVILKNGAKLFANLPIKTHSFNFLEWRWVYCLIGDTWFKPDEPEFLDALGISAEEAFPYTWIPDIPLNYRVPGPYPMDWHDPAKTPISIAPSKSGQKS